MDPFTAGAGITARFGMASGADHRHAEGDEAIAQAGRFARGKHQAGIGKSQAKRADELDQFAVRQGRWWGKAAGAGTKPRQGNRELRLPAMPEQKIAVGRQAERFPAPVAQAKESANSESAEAAGIGALGGREAPVKILFRPGGMELLVNFAVVGF